MISKSTNPSSQADLENRKQELLTLDLQVSSTLDGMRSLAKSRGMSFSPQQHEEASPKVKDIIDAIATQRTESDALTIKQSGMPPGWAGYTWPPGGDLHISAAEFEHHKEQFLRKANEGEEKLLRYQAEAKTITKKLEKLQEDLNLQLERETNEETDQDDEDTRQENQAGS